MRKINKDERTKLLEAGIRLGDGGISRNGSHHHVSWMLCESTFNLAKLDEIRNTNLAEERRDLENYNKKCYGETY